MASALQAQVDATICIIQETINSILEREERMDLFEDKTNGLFITSHGSCNEAN
jgi:hypothetical protein